MAYLFASASSQYLIGNSAPVTVEPLTIALWYRVASTPTNYMGAHIGRSAGPGGFRISVTGTTMLAQRVDNGGSTITSTTTVANTVGTWYHAAAVFLGSGSNITGYIGGVAGTPVTNTVPTLSTPDRIAIGTRLATGGAPGLYFDGDIAEVGVWNAALTADEIAGLAKGFPCRFARPSSLQFYSRLIRNIMDIRGGIALTNTNGATVSDHPRIIYPC